MTKTPDNSTKLNKFKGSSEIHLSYKSP